MEQTIPKLNISSGSENRVARILSNLNGNYPFWINKKKYDTVEQALQMIKYPEKSLERDLIFNFSGKNAGRTAKELGQSAKGKYVYWEGKIIEYNSEEHRSLLKMFIQEKFYQNRKAMDALLSTVDRYELVHNVGPENPNTSLPKKVFLEILIEIRNKELDLRKNMEE